MVHGSRVTLHYDPLLAKLIVHAGTREAAIDRMSRALEELVVAGVETCAPFHRRVMDEPDFRSGRISIRYLDEHPELLTDEEPEEILRAAAIAAALLEDDDRRHRAPRIGRGEAPRVSRWRASGMPGAAP